MNIQMSMRNRIAYHSPADVTQVVSLLGEADRAGVRARILAGGTALVPKLRQGQVSVDELISLKRLTDLATMSLDGERLRLGPSLTIAQLAGSAFISQHAPLLAQAAGLIGGPQIRNMATIGGNLCNAASYADLAAPLLILEASIETSSSSGRRRIPLERFFTGSEQTALRKDELVTEITISRRLASRPAIYDKLTLRRAMGIGLVNAGVSLAHRKGFCEGVSIALGAVGPTPVRAHAAEKILHNKKLSEALIEKAAISAAGSCQPADDVRASAWYRRRMVRVMVQRALIRLWKGGA